MSYIEAIKKGIHTVHKNWQLVLVQLFTMILSCIGFFIIVGIPVAVAFIMFGLDVTEILRLKGIVDIFKGSAELLSRYFAMAIIIILSLVIYLVFVVFLWVFALGGTAGIFANNILDETYKFTWSAFFVEGRKMFLPISMFSLIVGGILIALAFLLGILGGGASAIIEIAKTQERTLAVFLGVFFSMVLLSIGILLILITMSIAVFGIAYIAFNKAKPFNTLQETIKYLYSTPSSIGIYIILVIGYILFGLMAILIGYPFTLIPLIGTFLSLPLQLITYIIQGYVSLVMLSTLFHYYYETGYSLTLPLSSGDSDISLQTTSEQAQVRSGLAENQEE